MTAVMATAALATTGYAHITKNPRVCGGKACIDGTRIRVMDIVCLEREGKKPQEILHVFATPLTLAQVHAALAYYYDHPSEIEASFAEEDDVEAEIDRDRAEYLARPAGR
jgi:uncharacterized protein (DUF433 family)